MSSKKIVKSAKLFCKRNKKRFDFIKKLRHNIGT